MRRGRPKVVRTGWRTVDVAGQSLHAPVHYQHRRTLALHLRPGPAVELRVPVGCPEPAIDDFLHQRLGWLARKLHELPPPAPPASFRDGEPQPYLGVSYLLSLVSRPVCEVRLDADALRVASPRPERADRVKALLRQWYRERAAEVFGERLKVWAGRLQHLGLTCPTLRLRRMRRRWGSCSNRDVVTLNTRLVERPPALIDYVVVHELCHLIEFNHSPRFYALMDAAMPDWRTRGRALDGGRHSVD